MSTSAIDPVTENSAASQQTKQKKQGQSSNSDLFATMVQGQVPQNIVFTRVDRQLDVPKAAKTDDGQSQSTPFVDDRGDTEPDTVEKYETGISDDSAPVDRQDAASRSDSRDTGNNDTGASDGQDNAAAAETAQKPKDKGDANDGSEAAAGTAAAANTAAKPGTEAQRFATEVNVAKGPDQNAARQAANANVETNGNVQTQIASKDPALAQKAAGQARGNVTTSEQAVAKPAGTLAANAATTVQADGTAQAAQAKSAGDARPTATQLANAASDQETLVPTQAGPAKAKTAAGANGNEKSQAAGDTKQNASANGANQSQTAQNFAAMAANSAAPVQSAAQGGGAAGQVSAPLVTDPVSGAAPAQQAQTSAAARAAAKTAAAAKPNLPPQVLTEQVAVNINRAAGQGLDRITIQMRPQELGRVDVKMEVAQDGRLTAVISVERQETYDMLRADSRTLTQALQNAGLQADQNSLSFNLKGQGGDMTGNGSSGGGANGGEVGDGDGGMPDIGDGMLALGETAQPNADGRYDVRV